MGKLTRRDYGKTEGSKGTRSAEGTSHERRAERRELALRSIKQFEALSGVLQDRIRLIRFVLDVQKLPRTQWLAAIKTLKPDLVNLGGAILQRMVADPGLTKRLAIAVERFDGAARAVSQARAFVHSDPILDAPNVGAVLERLMAMTGEERQRRADAEGFEPKQLRTRVFLLTTYDLLFKNDPVLNQMFPPVKRENGLIKAEPAREPAKPKLAVVPEPAADSLMDKLMRRFRRGPPDGS